MSVSFTIPAAYIPGILAHGRMYLETSGIIAWLYATAEANPDTKEIFLAQARWLSTAKQGSEKET